MMQRRDFLRQFALAAAGAGWRLTWPRPAAAGQTAEPRLALLADAHLPSGDAALPEALRLARAVAEIRALTPAPDLVLFAGDLAHAGNPGALALGREILADLPCPLVLVRGEGDGPPGSASRSRLFGAARFSRPYPGFHLLALDTAITSTAAGPAFELGQKQIGWAAQELSRLDPNKPLLILSHAPLTRIFSPWQQFTRDAGRLTPLLARFRQVLCLHGHVHRPSFYTGDTDNTAHRGLPATAWPLPRALQGTPSALQPGLGPRGCGWALMAGSAGARRLQPQIWQA